MRGPLVASAVRRSAGIVGFILCHSVSMTVDIVTAFPGMRTGLQLGIDYRTGAGCWSTFLISDLNRWYYRKIHQFIHLCINFVQRVSKVTNSTESAAKVRYFVVKEDAEGQRIDNFLLTRLKGVPKSWVYRVLRKGEVRVNKGRVK
jgi:hypothetical protein